MKKFKIIAPHVFAFGAHVLEGAVVEGGEWEKLGSKYVEEVTLAEPEAPKSALTVSDDSKTPDTDASPAPEVDEVSKATADSSVDESKPTVDATGSSTAPKKKGRANKKS